MKITVIGDGAMATVCTLLLSNKGHELTMWSPMVEHSRKLKLERENKTYLEGFSLPADLKLTAEPDEAVKGTELIVLAIPTQYIRSVCKKFAPVTAADTPVVSVAKGIENQTLMTPTQIVDDAWNAGGGQRVTAALSGPSIALELARCLPATVCVASEDIEHAQAMQELFTTQWFRVYTNRDLLGVELAGATKNVIALAAGILDGLQAGNNAKSSLLSRGMVEISRLGVALGANVETFYGLTGVGDLATTCFSPTGRNRTAGEMLGKGMKLEDVLDQVHGVVEGVPTTQSVMELARRHDVEMPITSAVDAVLFKGMDPIDAITMLMSRAPKEEKLGMKL